MGVALPTIADKGRKCTATLTEKRIRVLIASKCLDLMYHKGPIRVSYSNPSWGFRCLHHKSSLPADYI
jgi:hypothetical protein